MRPRFRGFPPRTRRSVVLGATAAFSACVLAGCGVGIGLNAKPSTIQKKDVPFGLLDPSPPTTSAPAPRQFVTIYLEGPQRLVASGRTVAAPVTLRGIVTALGQGPTSAEAAGGLASPISTAAPLTLVRLSSGVATIRVAPTFTKLAEQDQAIAVAQLVYTVTAYPGVTSVEVHIGSKHARVPTGKGTLAGGPLVRTDYSTFAPI